MRTILSLCTFSLIGADVLSQSVVIPNALTNTAGGGGTNTLLRDQGQPRTYMLGIPASELMAIPLGSIINGLSFRSTPIGAVNPVTWPPVDTTW